MEIDAPYVKERKFVFNSFRNKFQCLQSFSLQLTVLECSLFGESFVRWLRRHAATGIQNEKFFAKLPYLLLLDKIVLVVF